MYMYIYRHARTHIYVFIDKTADNITFVHTYNHNNHIISNKLNGAIEMKEKN